MILETPWLGGLLSATCDSWVDSCGGGPDSLASHYRGFATILAIELHIEPPAGGLDDPLWYYRRLTQTGQMPSYSH